jgi:hypothetical protein
MVTAACGLFVRLVADGWCWFVLREKYWWLVGDGRFVLREKYCWLVADKPNEQGDAAASDRSNSDGSPMCRVGYILVEAIAAAACARA